MSRSFLILFFLVLLIAFQNITRVEANAIQLPVYSLGMPEEHINYTICRINGRLWAKVNGTYPINKIGIECQNQSEEIGKTGFTFSSDVLPLAYPTPPNTTNITIKMNGRELGWDNHTRTIPHDVHFTAIGIWPVIGCTLNPVLDQFVLEIHYEHPIIEDYGRYTFLYDLNISPYLSAESNKSTAFFTITFETDFRDLHVCTIATDGIMKPLDYSVSTEDTSKTVTLQIISEYSKSLPGDLLISFTENNEMEQNNSILLGSDLLVEQICAFMGALIFTTVTIAGFLSMKCKKGSEKD